MKVFRILAVTSAALAIVIAVLGSWVRINDAGLTCPDWPLCRGHLVPALAGGVVLEWSHRLVAFVEGFTVLGAILAGWRIRARIAGVTPTLIVLGVIFLLQISLGGATVLLANSPLSVMAHWAMGMALLATLTILAVLAVHAPRANVARPSWRTLREGPAPALGLAALFAFATMCVGAYVSSSYAGLACATFPACDGTLFGTGAAQFAQMSHRLAAGSFAVAAVLATIVALQTGSRRVRAFALLGCALLALQIVLGAANVVWRLPVDLREAHAANACATFLAFVVAAVLAALEPYRVPVRERVAAGQRVAQRA